MPGIQPFPESRPSDPVAKLAIPVEADPEDLTGRYQVRMLTNRETRPYVVIDTQNSDSIMQPAEGYRSRVAAQVTADRLNRSA